MLKRISHISLSLILLISTVGFAVSKHYCGDALVDVAFNENADSCCDDGACCHNETLIYQLDEDFSAPQITSAPDLPEMVTFGVTAFFAINQTPSEHLAETFYQNNSPPPTTISETLSFRQVFLL